MITEKQILTEGEILGKIIKLALPIMATSFAQMAYNMSDMFWIGKLGSRAVAAVGTAGFYMWLSFALIIVCKIGAEVGVSQSIGAKKELRAVFYATNAIYLGLFSALAYFVFINVNPEFLIRIFDIKEPYVVSNGSEYLRIVSFGMVFVFSIMIFSGIYNGNGDSKTPFFINFIGLLLNMVLDPLLIFGWMGFPELNVKGAALATVFSQGLVFIIFLFYLIIPGKKPFPMFTLRVKLKKKVLANIIKLGSPVGLQSALFTIFAMIIARIITAWGAIPIAVQKVGAQIEAVSWMTASGFSTALGSFTGQNYGAKMWDRIQAGFFSAMMIISIIGLMTSFALIFFAEPIFAFFIDEKEALSMGVSYLRILGVSQLFMCWEITTSGAFYGIGKTKPPAVISIVFNGLRIPGALILSSSALLGLNGVWWSISISSVFKGIILFVWFLVLLHNHPNVKRSWFHHMLCLNMPFLRDKRSMCGK